MNTINETNLMVIYLVVVTAFILVPVLANMLLAYLFANRQRHNLMMELVNRVATDKLATGELKEILEESRKEAFAMPGLARSTMALAVILVLGIAVFHVIVIGVHGTSPSNDDSQIVNNILSMLAGLLAAITGFYFGGKAAEKK
jgi:hypothetical protein